jgi:hypothetical protein
VKCRCEAILITSEGIYYAPWMLVRADEEVLKVYVKIRCASSELPIDPHRLQLRSSRCPSSYILCFHLLTGFCHAKNPANECMVALAIVLMLTSGMTAAELSFPSPTIPSQSTECIAKPESPANEFYDKLFASLDKFLSLSSKRMELILCMLHVF